MPDTNSNSEVLLDLAQPRVVAIEDRGRQYVLKCRRIEPADWLLFFNAITVTSESNGREVINVTDIDSPRVALAEAVLMDAMGYKVDGAERITDLPSWRSRLPIAHRRKLGEVLSDARPESSDELVISGVGEVISLSSTWTAADVVPGERITMQRISGLRHNFEAPSEAQYRRYQRAANRVKIVGGSRSGKTVYMGAHAALAELYDELIVSVAGYSVNGSPLSGRDAIAAQMDMHHKVMAAQQVFLPQSNVTTSIEEEAE